MRHANLGQIVIASEVIHSGPSPRRARSVIILLAASVGLMMTGFGIILPVFARRLGEFGSGVEALGLDDDVVCAGTAGGSAIHGVAG